MAPHHICLQATARAPMLLTPMLCCRFASDIFEESPRHSAGMQRVLSRSKLSLLTLHDMISRSSAMAAGPAAAASPSLTPFAATAAAIIAGAAGDELTGGRPGPVPRLSRTTSLEYDDPSDDVFMQVRAGPDIQQAAAH